MSLHMCVLPTRCKWCAAHGPPVCSCRGWGNSLHHRSDRRRRDPQAPYHPQLAKSESQTAASFLTKTHHPVSSWPDHISASNTSVPWLCPFHHPPCRAGLPWPCWSAGWRHRRAPGPLWLCVRWCRPCWGPWSRLCPSSHRRTAWTKSSQLLQEGPGSVSERGIFNAFLTWHDVGLFLNSRS